MAQDVLKNDAVQTYEIPRQLRRVMVGPNGTVVKRVAAETGAGVTLLNDNSNSSRVLLRGNKEAREAAWSLIERIVYTEVGEDTVKVDRRTVTELLRNRASRCKELELSTGTYISVVKDDGSSGTKADDAGFVEVVVRGLEENRQIVKAALTEIQEQGPERYPLSELAAEGCVVSILDVRRIIGSRGARVMEMEESTGASIRLEVEPEPYVSVMGSREQKDAALGLIRTLLNQDDQEMVPLAEELHGVIIGVSGRSVQMIEKKSGAQISFRPGPDAAMVVRCCYGGC
jgi:polyribonucleotide nucleotidyltransferase